LETAALHLRAAMVIEPDWLDAVYNYGRACRHLYAKSEDPEFIKDFKAEATWALEYTTEKHPNFAQAYYFLGYQYINAGLYIKAQLIWERFLKLSKHRKDKGEIKLRLKQIQRPVQFEKGYSAIERGKWKEGIGLLEPMLKVDPEWWNLFFFLGVGYSRTGRTPEAIDLFKRVLQIKPSQELAMRELADCYETVGDTSNAEKYRNKADLVVENKKSEQIVKKDENK
jgi:tetratricopeptide (TPR) repeat protein